MFWLYNALSSSSLILSYYKDVYRFCILWKFYAIPYQHAVPTVFYEFSILTIILQKLEKRYQYLESYSSSRTLIETSPCW